MRIIIVDDEELILEGESDLLRRCAPEATDLTGKPSGIRNIREMPKHTGSGTLEIHSAPGQGAAAELHITKK